MSVNNQSNLAWQERSSASARRRALTINLADLGTGGTSEVVIHVLRQTSYNGSSHGQGGNEQACNVEEKLTTSRVAAET